MPADPSGVSALGRELGLWTVLPFVALLASIALLPLVAAVWWERHRNKGLVCLLLSAPVVLRLVAYGPEGTHELVEKLREYLSFLVLLASLFVIAGGIRVRGAPAGTPRVNTAFLGLGAVLASVIGTMGASVLLLRPFLAANATRARRVHLVVFFLFIVSNCGGLLTPLGDPPLFLGFQRGVPFEWTLTLLPEWALVNVLLLVLFHVLDRRAFAREAPPASAPAAREPMTIEGANNFLLLLGVVLTLVLAGRGVGSGGRPWSADVRDAALVSLTLASYVGTAPAVRAGNRFTFGPIVEVAVLFAGIFVTMTPALLVLNAWGLGEREVLGQELVLRHPAQYFWVTGALSSVLDNAPTYLTLVATASGAHGIPLEGAYLADFLARGPEAARVLAAISCGAVFMGANTYIGNGPNFVVKAMAEESGIAMPSFLGYMAWSGGILLPIFGLVTLVHFR